MIKSIYEKQIDWLEEMLGKLERENEQLRAKNRQLRELLPDLKTRQAIREISKLAENYTISMDGGSYKTGFVDVAENTMQWLNSLESKVNDES